MPFKTLKPFKFPVCAQPIYLPEVQRNEKGEINIVNVNQSKELPDSSTTKLSVQLAAGVPLKQTGTVMMRDVSGVPANLQAALDSDAKFNEEQKQKQQQQQQKQQTNEGDEK